MDKDNRENSGIQKGVLTWPPIGAAILALLFMWLMTDTEAKPIPRPCNIDEQREAYLNCLKRLDVGAPTWRLVSCEGVSKACLRT